MRRRDPSGARRGRVASGTRGGDVIQLADGSYPGNFTATAQGSATAPITLCGGRNVVLAGVSGYTLHLNGLHLNGAAHRRIAGFTIRGGQKGIVADRASANLIEGLLIEQIGQEGLHPRAASTDNMVRGNQIRFTGRTTPEFGEGIYVGSAVHNWGQFGGESDRGDRNVIEGNTISDTPAECVYIKEGTTGGTVRTNTFSGRTLVGGYADSWVDVKGNGWTISGNSGVDMPTDGYQVHQIVQGWGLDNRFDANTSTPRAGHRLRDQRDREPDS